jgi:glycosyltransferase involved in cell wall biosynthesis
MVALTGKLLSACMMVKNESTNLERCLKSLSGLVDEIIVVDTGSTDNTVEIAKKYGAKVYHHPWANDFSKHRNQSINYATGKWILIVDADEEITFKEGCSIKDARKFLKKLENQFPAAAFNVKDIQHGMTCLQFTSARVFLNGKIHYEGRVHNQAVINGGGKAMFYPGIDILHYGYDMTPEQKQAKFERTSGLLLKRVEDNDIANGLMYFYLCQIFANNNMHESAVKWGEKYLSYQIENNTDKESFCQSIYFTMIKSYIELENSTKAADWLNLAVKELPGDLDIAFAAIEYGIFTKNDNLVINAAKEYSSIYENFMVNPSLKGNRFIFSLRPEALCFALYHQSILQAQGSMKALGELMKNLENVPDGFKNGMAEDLSLNFGKLGINIQFNNHIRKK